MNTKIRVLMVIHSFSVGGGEKQFLNLIKGLDRNKFEIEVCSFGLGEYCNELPQDIVYHCIQKKSKYSILKLIAGLAKVIRQRKPDLIYTRMQYATFIANIARSIFRFNVPIVANEEHNRKQEIMNLKNNKIARYLSEKRLEFAYGSSDFVLVPTQGVKEDIVRAYRLNPSLVRVINNSVDIDQIRKSLSHTIQLPSWWNSSFKLVAFGRLAERKGHDFLLKVFGEVVKKSNSELIFIGDGEQKAELENMVSKMCLTGKVHFMGYVNNPYYYISKCNLFVMSSLWEGFGNVIIEAMACGLPVVVTNFKHGPHEILKGSSCGYIISDRSVNEMSCKIIELYNNRNLLSVLSRNAINRANDFRLNKVVGEFENAFTQVVGDK